MGFVEDIKGTPKWITEWLVMSQAERDASDRAKAAEQAAIFAISQRQARMARCRVCIAGLTALAREVCPDRLARLEIQEAT